MKKTRQGTKWRSLFLIMALLVILVPATAFAAEATQPEVFGSVWALVPPLVAIALALITKEVYSSLFIGILIGGFFYSGFSFEGTINHIFEGGIVNVLSDSYNVGIIIFLVVLGIMVAMMNKAGGSVAFGDWASRHIKSRVGVQLATTALGVLIFIDDYFNCLTVGSVMRPVTDKQNISRAKLAYLIDATAAPVCIIAPISSWAAAVTGFVDGEDGFSLFIQAIPYNFYAILTIVMMITITIAKFDYGPMKLHELNAEKGDLYTTPDRPYKETDKLSPQGKGKVVDLVFPILLLILACTIGMIYTGGFFEGASFVEAFSQSDASIGLVYGSFCAFLIMVVFYALRKVLGFSESMSCVPEGFKAMVPAILILTLAWTLKSMTDSLGLKEFVEIAMKGTAKELMYFLPAVIFVVACLLAFASGTSWGTFGILIPIVLSVFEGVDHNMMVMGMSACMAGAVCGDHCSPISDTTIMASAGAQCNHVNHVYTQMPYAITVAAVSFVTYIIAGFVRTPVVALPIGVVLMIGTLLAIKKFNTDLGVAKK